MTRLKRIPSPAKGNEPHHGLGEHGRPRHVEGLMAGAHMPQRVDGKSRDGRGYADNTAVRRNGRLAGGSLKADADTRRRHGAEGNSKGSPPPGTTSKRGVRGTPDSHLGTAGRGGTGRHGKADNFKGQPTKLSEAPTHDWFEKLGS